MLGLAASGCSRAEPEPEVVQLGKSAAAERYLEVVCPSNDAWDRLDAAIDELRLTEALGDPDPEEARAAAAEVKRENKALIAGLEDPALAWPSPARGPIEELVAAVSAEQRALTEITTGTAAEILAQQWPAEGGAAAAARAALGLTESPEASCAELAAAPKRTPAEPSESPTP